jgi:hypothetical protein
MTEALTLSDVLARGVSVQWHEAVAVVRAVAEALMRSPEKSQLLPELHQIQVLPDGGVAVIGGTVVHEPVRRLGQLLQATLGQSEPPVQLRLLVSQATAPIPAYASMREIDEALGYFERPGRDAVLRDLYTRASQAAAASAVVTMPTLDTIVPLPQSETPKTARTKPAAKSTARAVRLVSIGAVVVLLCGAGAQYLRVSGKLPGATRMVSAVASRGLRVFGDTVVNGLSWATERVGLGRMVSGETSAVESPQSGATTPTRPARTERTRPVTSEAASAESAHSSLPHGPGSTAATTDVAVNTSGSIEPPTDNLSSRMVTFAAFDLEPVGGSASRPAAVTEVPALPNSPSGVDDAEGGDSAIYSPRSEGVASPIALRPQLPRELPPDVNRSELRLIELVISPLGTVESVRLIGDPRNVHDSMLLSAAKAWVFRPAVKDGVPVRYRKTVSVAPRS